MPRKTDTKMCLMGLLLAAAACDSEMSRPMNGGTDGSTSGTGGDGSSSGASMGESTSDGGSDSGSDSADGTTGDTGDTGSDPGMAGLLFTLDNADGLANVVMFSRESDGALQRIGSFITGGMGSAGGLGSQGGLAIDGEDYLYVVNPGDDTVSSMRIYEDHLGLVDVMDSGGLRPTSLVVGNGHLYVMNADGPGSVQGFSLDEGRLEPIDGASRPLSGHEAPAPAQIGMTPDQEHLVVTERATNQIVTYEIADDGSLGDPVVNASEGQTPFGFGFTSDGVFVVSEAFGGGANPGASAASSYRVSDGGSLWTYSASIPSGETAACWIAVVRDRFAYTTNTGSNTVSAYEIADPGEIELFGGGGTVVDFGDDHGPIDIAVSADEQYLYVLNAAADNIAGFAIGDDGSLTEVVDPVDVPEHAVGLAGR